MQGLDLGSQRREPVSVRITLLGGFRVTVDGLPTASSGWARRSAAALVKVLALAPGHRVHRERLMDLLWPDEPVDRSAPRLHKAAHYARRAAGRVDAVVLSGDVVALFPGADLTVDAVRFEDLAREAVDHGDERAAREALALYRGELLPGDRYEDWAADRRELLHLRRLDLLRVVGAWRELTELDPTDEEAHVALMHSQLANGDVDAALRQYEHFERVLERELGVRPGEAARRTFEGAARSARVDTLVAELAEVVSRATEVLAELSAVGCAPPALTLLEAAG